MGIPYGVSLFPFAEGFLLDLVPRRDTSMYRGPELLAGPVKFPLRTGHHVQN